MSDVKVDLARRKLREFVAQGWHVLEPGTTFVPGWHIDLICEYLEAVTLGQIKRLIINIPPRHMKSLLVAVFWPCWEWGPRGLSHLRYLFSSFDGDLAIEHNVARRTLIKSEWFQSNWPIKLLGDQNQKSKFSNTKRGHMNITSTGASDIGKGGNRVIVDDPLNPKVALSEPMRKQANTSVDNLYTRLNDKSKDAYVMIMQRMHEDDPSGHLIHSKKDMDWTVLEIPAIQPADKTYIFPVSKKELHLKKDDLIWPGKENAKVIAEAKTMLGSYGFAGQYQQKPAPDEGGYIKRKWWKRFEMTSLDHVIFDQIIISADPAFKDASTGSQVAIHVWASKGPNKYLIDRMTKHMSMTETMANIIKVRQRWHSVNRLVTAVLIEDKANGPAVIDVLGRKIPGLIPYPPRGSKFARAMAVAPSIESGNVYVSLEPWGDEVIDAWAFVPNGSNWDDVDAASQALDFLSAYEIPGDAPIFVAGQLESKFLTLDNLPTRAKDLDWG